MTVNEAYEKYVGLTYNGGKIIGISGRPKLGYKDELYATVIYSDKPAEFVPIRELEENL